MNTLEEALAERRRHVSAETLSMSVGELTSLYRDGTLNVHPEFQRVFRWNEQQKTALVESLLLGIPIPSIFVAVTDEQWELVDGVQRVSTVLELQGELRDIHGDLYPPLTMSKASLLSELEGFSWEGGDPSRAFSSGQKLDLRTARIDVKLLKRDSSPQTKYDLFQRLNAQGSVPTRQELRNCLIVSESPDFLSLVEELATLGPFVDVVSLPDRLVHERYNHELVIRFLALHERDIATGIGNLHDFLDEQALALASRFSAGALTETVERFKKVFRVLQDNGGEDVFRRWIPTANRFGGPFLIGAYEVFALGIGFCLATEEPYRTDLQAAARELWTEHGGTSESGGRNAEQRVARTIPRGRDLLRLANGRPAPTTDALPLGGD